MAAQLKSIGTLVAETWEEYRDRALPILAVQLLSSVLVLLAIFLAGLILVRLTGGLAPLMAETGRGRLSLPVLLSVLGGLFAVSSFFILWGQSAVLAIVVDRQTRIARALAEGMRRMWSLGWILFLAGGIVMAGFLLVVPGLLFSTWFVFATFILYAEDRRGLDALLASRAYVRGHFWNTLGKLLLLWLIALLIGMIPWLGQVLSFLFTPYLFLFMMAMYRDLSKGRGGEEVQGNRLFWGTLAAIGLSLPALGLVGAAVTLAPQWPELVRQIRQVQVIQEQSGPTTRHDPAAGQDAPVKERPLSVPPHPVPGQAVWRDPMGDVAAARLSRWLDIRSVTVVGRNGTLEIDVRLFRPVQGFFTAAATMAHHFSPLLSLYLDTDVDRRTGGVATGGPGRSGYDRVLKVVLEADAVAAGRGRAHVSLYRLQGGRLRSLGPLPMEKIQLHDDGMTLHVPYATLGLQQGSRLRICYREEAQEQGTGLSRDSLITLQ